ncbi:hypothetical protein [Snuella sedimenti]|uniref:DUF3379 domain-containing protein n=1 Tax=Snuella sedimenti TaxID=2798802 RepID=A0A8J7IGJ2_9FLAO|nr:hypothetical protein [Snuella sedimenti]MBJ6369242.1 hypothetical protein [Snuella sedimenti]
MDHFEKIIKENKDLFDEFKADKTKLWANIEPRLNTPGKKTKHFIVWKHPLIKVAASVVVLLGMFLLVDTFYSKFAIGSETIVAHELQDIDKHYKGLVAQQVMLINKNATLTKGEKETFLAFMDELDKEYQTLKIEFHKNIDSERILEAIIINYRKRIELIEKLLKQINRSKNIENEDVYIL